MERANNSMSDEEFLVMDELYFVTSFADLLASGELSEDSLIDTLQLLIEKKWVKCYKDPDNEVSITPEILRTNYNNFQYLATKQGLLAHNMR